MITVGTTLKTTSYGSLILRREMRLYFEFRVSTQADSVEKRSLLRVLELHLFFSPRRNDVIALFLPVGHDILGGCFVISGSQHTRRRCCT